MCRVSSQSTSSASRQLASTRRVTSSRLPIGVAQTASGTTRRAPRRRRTPRRRGPLRPELGRDDAHRARALEAAPHARRPPAPGRAGARRAWPKPPPMTTSSGSKMLIEASRSPAPSCRPIWASASRRSRLHARLPRRARRRRSPPPATPWRAAIGRLARSNSLEVAGPAAAHTRARRRSWTTMCPSSAPAPVAPRNGLPSRIEPAADAGPESEQTRLSVPRPAPTFHSAIAAAFPSLSIAAGRPKRSFIRSRKSRSASGMFTERHDAPGPLVDRATAGRSPSATRRPSCSSVDQLVELGEEVLLRAAGLVVAGQRAFRPSVCMDERRRAIFVPPTSTPITGGLATWLRYAADGPEDKPYRVYRGGRVKGGPDGWQAGADDEPRRTPAPPHSAYPGPGPRRSRSGASAGAAASCSALGCSSCSCRLGACAASSRVRSGAKDANERLGARRKRRARAAGRPAALAPERSRCSWAPTTRRPARAQGLPALGLDHARSAPIRDAPHSATSRSRATCASRFPGYGFEKINAAIQIGGPALAIRTIRQFIGLEVNHVVIVDFDGFKELIDAVGGIDDQRAGADPLEQVRLPVSDAGALRPLGRAGASRRGSST